MSSKISNIYELLFRKIPIVKRITIWYSLFIFLIIFALFTLSFFVLDDIVLSSNKSELESEVKSMAYEENINDIKSFDDGIFFSIYDSKGNKIKGDIYIDEQVAPKLQNNSFSDITYENTNYSIYDVFVKNENNSESYWVRGVMPLAHIQRDTSLLILITIIVLPINMLIILYAGYLITKNAFKPINNIIEIASEIERSGDLSQRINVGYGNDEINKLSTVFNSMLSSLETSYNRERDFTGNAAHELKTPLSVISLESQYILDYENDINEAKNAVRIIKRKSDDMSILIDQLLQLSRLDGGDFTKYDVDISQLLQKYLSEFKTSKNEEKIDFIFDIEENIIVATNETMFLRIMANLMSNAIKFTKDKVIVSLKTLDDNKKIFQLSVSDNGSGISAKDIARVWERFYQVDKSRNKDEKIGHGIGLSIVKKLIDLQGWDIKVESDKNIKTSFIITIS